MPPVPQLLSPTTTRKKEENGRWPILLSMDGLAVGSKLPQIAPDNESQMLGAREVSETAPNVKLTFG